MRNLHKYYYKDYFAGADFSPLLNGGDSAMRDLKEKNQNLCSPNLLKVIEKSPLVNTVFTLEIQYPGLVTGVGIKHETKIEGEFKLGVHFDWTHGMPVVYGSSVKGVLRSWFMDVYETSEVNTGIDSYDLLMDIFSGLSRDVEEEKKLYKDEWGEKVKDVKKRIYNPKSIYERDVFFDAVIVEADSKGRILASDSITPHGGENHDNPLKNPTPLTFMKIASGCRMEFRFKLMDTIIDGKKFSAAQKKTLFEEILKTVGVGAKTNVGYGQLK